MTEVSPLRCPRSIANLDDLHEIAHKAFDLARTREELREGTMLPAIPVRVSGQIGSLSYRADASAVPVATLRGVLGLPRRAGKVATGAAGTVRDAAGALGGEVRGGARRLRGPSSAALE